MPEPKKILFVITKATWGGAQKYVYELATATQAAGYATVVAYGQPGLLVAKLSAQQIRTIHLRSLARDIKSANDRRALGELRKMFKDERPAIVHLNSSKAAALGALAARLEQAPQIIYTAHGWAFNESRPLWQKVLLRMAAEGDNLPSARDPLRLGGDPTRHLPRRLRPPQARRDSPRDILHSLCSARCDAHRAPAGRSWQALDRDGERAAPNQAH